MDELISRLDDETAIRVLTTFARAQQAHGQFETEWSPELEAALTNEVELPVEPAPVADAELARATLLLLASDPANHEPLQALIENPAAEAFALDPGTIALGVAALIALQTHVKFERSKDGQISFKIERKPLPANLLNKLIGWFTSSQS